MRRSIAVACTCAILAACKQDAAKGPSSDGPRLLRNAGHCDVHVEGDRTIFWTGHTDGTATAAIFTDYWLTPAERPSSTPLHFMCSGGEGERHNSVTLFTSPATDLAAMPLHPGRPDPAQKQQRRRRGPHRDHQPRRRHVRRDGRASWC